jgi:hypothetical protein
VTSPASRQLRRNAFTSGFEVTRSRKASLIFSSS